MELYHWDTAVDASLPPHEAIKLIRKLRWVGVEGQAQLRAKHDAERGGQPSAGVLANIPYSTD